MADTSALAEPEGNVFPPGEEPVMHGTTRTVQARSMVILIETSR